MPKPAPGIDEVLVKVRAVSINSWDWDMLTGKPFEYRFFSGLFKPKSVKIHGCDVAGVVAAVGQNVVRFNVGDEVFGDLAESGWGAFSDYTCAPANMLSLKPSGMSFEDAACLSHGGNLAVQGLIDFGRIKSGQKVLINGGGGCTGTLAIQIAKQFDIDLTCVDRAEKLDLMRSLGADHVIDYTQNDFTQCRQHYDLIFDVKTNRSVFDYMRVLSPNGSYVSVGGKTSRILQLVLLGRLIKRYKLHMVAYKANKDLDYLITLYEAGKIKPLVDKCYPLEKSTEAFEYFGAGNFKGKVVIQLDTSKGNDE
jgi:NADPH:quinone reductase-like Zn-dependent oxidoreductase